MVIICSIFCVFYIYEARECVLISKIEPNISDLAYFCFLFTYIQNLDIRFYYRTGIFCCVCYFYVTLTYYIFRINWKEDCRSDIFVDCQLPFLQIFSGLTDSQINRCPKFGVLNLQYCCWLIYLGSICFFSI